jgi:hypothetical protein
MLVLGLGLVALHGWVGTGLRRLDSRVRLVAGVVSGIGLLSFPFGTLLNGYVLYLLFCEKGSRVLSSEYQQVVAQTPDVRVGISLLVLALGLLPLAALVVAVIAELANHG